MVVHRLLTAALQLEHGGQQGAEPGKPQAGNKDMEELAEHINSRNRVSGLLGLGGSVLPERCLSCCDVGRRPSEPRTFPPDSSSASSSRSATRRRTRAAWPTPSSTPSGTMACWSSFQSKELFLYWSAVPVTEEHFLSMILPLPCWTLSSMFLGFKPQDLFFLIASLLSSWVPPNEMD